MDSKDYWQMFMETGAPELYLLYQNARKMEINHVLEDRGTGSPGYSLQ